MPELPEVQTVVDGIKDKLIGKKIIIFKKFTTKLRYPIDTKINHKIKNLHVLNIKRVAKYIIINLSDNYTLIIHLGMSGRIILNESNAKKESKHNHFIICFTENIFLKYFDPRKFGLIKVVKTEEFLDLKFIKNLGIEPLSKKFNSTALKSICNKKRSNIKSIIMNQKYLVGVGNIYASEALFISKINPLKEGCRLTSLQLKLLVKAIKFVLKKSIKLGGSSINDYALVSGNLGNYQNNVKVYGREGLKCVNKSCNSLIIRIVISNRSTFMCPKCQK